MGEFCATEKDSLKWAKVPTAVKVSRRIGIHTSIAGGVENAAERAHRLGCNTCQIFSSSPRQWQPYTLGRGQCEVMSQLRQKYDLKPLVIHSNYLINLAGSSEPFRSKSIAAFRGELERGAALCAEYLVLHPGSFRGSNREQGLELVARGIEEPTQSAGSALPTQSAGSALPT
jgi:deoxyribonuclease-4